jgi:hypothetical protein
MAYWLALKVIRTAGLRSIRSLTTLAMTNSTTASGAPHPVSSASANGRDMVIWLRLPLRHTGMRMISAGSTQAARTQKVTSTPSRSRTARGSVNAQTPRPASATRTR